MGNYEEAKVKLTNNQLESSSLQKKNKAGQTLKVTKKDFKMKNFHTNYYWQKTKIKVRNAFANNIWKDIKLNKSQLSKAIQSGIFLGALLYKLAKSLFL